MTTMPAPTLGPIKRAEPPGPVEYLLAAAAEIERTLELRLTAAAKASGSSTAVERLGQTALRALTLIEENRGVTPSTLAGWLHQETHSTSGLLNRMEDAELITRERDRIDRRVVHCYITDTGRIHAAETRAIVGELDALVRDCLGKGGLGDLRELETKARLEAKARGR